MSANPAASSAQQSDSCRIGAASGPGAAPAAVPGVPTMKSIGELARAVVADVSDERCMRAFRIREYFTREIEIMSGRSPLTVTVNQENEGPK